MSNFRCPIVNGSSVIPTKLNMATKFIATVMGSRLQVLVSQEPVHHIQL
uniref:Uncharacterized protein n=2 Tax=Anguilla anguilla TaxID=7936 RepID=A0A0E9PTX3_ANGAN